MLDVAYTWAAVRPADVAVVIDVLRATSTITQALAAGYQRVLCCDCVAAAEGLRSPGRVVAGERGCLPPSGFDLGNSPAAFDTPLAAEVALATTNGCPAIVTAAENAGEVLLASLLNLDALVNALPADADVLLLCAGTRGHAALEDTYVAGRIAACLGGDRTDATKIAQAVARAYADPGEALAASANGEQLRQVGLGEDIVWCARESQLDVVPRVASVEGGVAAVETLAWPAEPHSGVDTRASLPS